MSDMVCADLLIGELSVQNMSVEVFSRWQADKVVALGRAIEAAKVQGAERCVIAGGLFAPGFVPQSLVETCMECLAKAGVPVTYCPRHDEATDLASRVEVPANVCVMHGESCKVDGSMEVRFGLQGASELLYKSQGTSVTKSIPVLEPSGFSDSRDSGYLLVAAREDGAASVVERGIALHPFIMRSVDLTGLETSKEVLSAVKQVIETTSPDACLRLVLRGKLRLGLYIAATDLVHYLNERFFYAEVSDEYSTDVDEEALATDVSLWAEFIRQVESDDSLSPVEKSRIVRCGWNALNAKELAE